MKQLLILIALISFTTMTFTQINDTIYLWPNDVPGETASKHDPVITDDTSGNTTRLIDVTNPAMMVFNPKPEIHNGKAIIVCPGGGYRILSIDKEGYEIAEWLNSLGYTAFVLQYRVPDKQEGALMDIQRAIRIVRGNAHEMNIDPHSIGLIGFSAGASLSARISTNYSPSTYEPIDAKDNLSARPDYAMLIYPAYLDKGDNRSLTPELKIDKNTPPMFIFATADDTYANSALVMAQALRDAKVPVELHFLPYGGHGYGLREGNEAAEFWPIMAEQWLEKTIEKN